MWNQNVSVIDVSHSPGEKRFFGSYSQPNLDHMCYWFGRFYLPQRDTPKMRWGRRRHTPSKVKDYACKPKSTRWIITNIKQSGPGNVFVENKYVFSPVLTLCFAIKCPLNTQRSGSFALNEVNSQPHRPVPGWAHLSSYNKWPSLSSGVLSSKSNWSQSYSGHISLLEGPLSHLLLLCI